MPDSVFRKVSTSDSVGSQGSTSGRVSLGNLMNARRMTRRFTINYFGKKKMSSSRSINFQDLIKLEPTYRMEPESKLPLNELRVSIENLIKKKVSFVQYDSKKAALTAQVLCDDIKNEVKTFGIERYKILVHAILGSVGLQQIDCIEKYVWDSKWDDYLTFHHKNSSMFITVTVYFVYRE